MATDNKVAPSSWELGPEARSFVESSNESIFIFEIATDPAADDALVFVNEQTSDVFGYSRDELLHVDFLSLGCNEPSHHQLNMKEVRNKVVAEGPQGFEWHAKAKDGHLFWVEANIRHWPRDGRNYLIVRVHNIAARKQREADLQSAKDFAENLLETANAMVVRLDVDGNIQIINEAAEAITGYAAAEILGRNWFEVLVPKSRFPHVWEEFQRLRAGGLPKRFENPILTKFGEERFTVWRNNEIREQGQIVGTISFGVDITEHRQAEKALQESEARNLALLTAIPDVLLLLNNKGILLDFHFNGLPNLFTSLKDNLNRPIADALPSPLGELIVAACNRALETGAMQQIEHQMAANGPVEYLEARVVKSGEKTVFVMLRDITEGRKLQEQLMVSDRMASVGTLAAGVAHEINNPLAAIMANIELIISKFTKLAPQVPDDEVREIREDLTDALDATIRVKNIVSDLRIFSRSQEVRDGTVDIEHLLESSLRMAYNEIRHRAKVVRDFQPVPPVKWKRVSARASSPQHHRECGASDRRRTCRYQ